MTQLNLYRGIHEIFPENSKESLRQKLQSDRPLRVKLGIDPTSADIHLGHSILFRKLRSFQDAGHTAVLVIGDFTARLGDPTGKSEVRRQLTEEEVVANAETYLKQVRSILDFETPGRLEVYYNSVWLSKLDFPQVLDLLATMTVGQMLAKEGFAERHKQGAAIHLHEFLYPLMQGYDSVVVQADVELGGTDQKFNLAVGRNLQRHFGQTPQFGLLMPILIGTDGVQKMSKSLGNYVGLSEDALSMYSKLEKTPDALVCQYFELLTDLPLDKISLVARDRQKRLALEIVSQYHGRKAALEAQSAAVELSQGNTSAASIVSEYSLESVQFPVKASYLISRTGLCQTNSDARRQIEGGAIRLDGKKLIDVNFVFESPNELIGKVIQFGKNKFIRLSGATQ